MDSLPNAGADSLDRLADVFCGSVAGAIGKVFEYPFDTIKVRLQSQPDGLPLQYKGPLDCFKQSLRNEGGVFGLYRGLLPPIVGAAAENASLFLVYNAVIDTVGNSIISGAISGLTASFLLTPIELVKCRIQIQDVEGFHKSRQGVVQVIREIMKTGGLRSFWRGQTGTMLREAGGSGSWFGAYDYVGSFLRSRAGRQGDRDTNTIGESMISGACAGIAYNISLFPADTIKSRMQTNADNGEHRGFLQTGKAVYRSGGIPALYRGLGITLLRAAPSSAIIFLSYDKVKSVWTDWRRKKGIVTDGRI